METDEELETGYGAGAPRGDNLLNDFVQGEADAFAELALERGDRVVEDDEFGLMLTDGGSPTPFGNVAVLRRPLVGRRVAGGGAPHARVLRRAARRRLHDVLGLVDAGRPRRSASARSVIRR